MHFSSRSVTVIVNIATVVVMLTPSVPAAYRALSIVPSTAINNIMACRVYREVKLGMMDDGPMGYPSRSHTFENETSSSLHFAGNTISSMI